ncbi:MAG: hypothetical protein ACREE3_10960 [Stellaceae bacterium]
MKILVAFLGFLLVAGLVVLGLAITYNVGDRHRHVAESAPAVTIQKARHAVITLPAGARILNAHLAGDRLLVRILLPGGGEEFALYDWKTGAQVGVLDFRPAVAAH